MPVKVVDKQDDLYTLIEVKVLHDEGKTALIEWVSGDQLKRGFVPSKVITESGCVSEKALSAATPYGIPWAKIAELHATPESIEAALHRAGIWTFEDLRTKPMPALGAIQAAYHLDVGTLLMAAQKYEKGE